MLRCASLFSQVLSLINRHQFAAAAKTFSELFVRYPSAGEVVAYSPSAENIFANSFLSSRKRFRITWC